MKKLIEEALIKLDQERELNKAEKNYFTLEEALTELRPILNNVLNKIENPFFLCRLIKTVRNEERIVEIGDGQVSDLVGWEAPRFI